VLTTLSGLLLLLGFSSHALRHGLADAFVAGEGGDGHVFPVLSIVLYLVAILAGGWFIFPKAASSFRRLRPDMNLLMVIAVMGAVFIGEWFEAATVTFLFSLSLLLEQWSVGRARRAIRALMDLSPDTAWLLTGKNGELQETPVEDVPLEATIVIRPGEWVPLDGTVTKGQSSVNQAPITGESKPVAKDVGDDVFAGTINEDGALEICVTKDAKQTTLARIINMIEDAQSRRAASEQWIEKFARYYTPAMIVLAFGIAIFPPMLTGASWSQWLYQALVILVIACPCALVISTPVSIVSGITAAARAGLLIKGGAYLELAGRIQVLCLDKTGTLTYGHPEIQDVIPLAGHTSSEVLVIAATLESHSEHPIARAILKKSAEQGLKGNAAENLQAIKGKGVEATVEGKPFWIGSHRLMKEKGQETEEIQDRISDLEDAGHTVVALGNDEHVCGLITVADGVRKEAQETVQALRQTGIKKVIMLTGDNSNSAGKVATMTGVDEFHAELLPEDKVKAVESQVATYHYVAMVGDGVNDAPAMAAATFGIAMGAMGTDVAIETADIALMSDDLSKLPWLIAHSRRTLRIIKQNITFSLGLKLVFIILAFFNIATLWMAIAADMGASLLVIFNGLRLLGGRNGRL
jgi:Cd2+/Zn2+-exporting ATPase